MEHGSVGHGSRGTPPSAGRSCGADGILSLGTHTGGSQCTSTASELHGLVSVLCERRAKDGRDEDGEESKSKLQKEQKAKPCLEIKVVGLLAAAAACWLTSLLDCLSARRRGGRVS